MLTLGDNMSTEKEPTYVFADESSHGSGEPTPDKLKRRNHSGCVGSR